MEHDMDVSYDQFLKQKERRKKSRKAKSEESNYMTAKRKSIKRLNVINGKNYMDFIEDEVYDI